MEEIWREMRWIMDALQHARYKQPSCGVSLSGFLSEAGPAMKEKTQSTSSHLDYLPSPAPSPETSRKINSGKEPALQSSCHRAQGAAHARGNGGLFWLAALWACRQGQCWEYGQGSCSLWAQDLLCWSIGEHSNDGNAWGLPWTPSGVNLQLGLLTARLSSLCLSYAPCRLTWAVR